MLADLHLGNVAFNKQGGLVQEGRVVTHDVVD